MSIAGYKSAVFPLKLIDHGSFARIRTENTWLTAMRDTNFTTKEYSESSKESNLPQTAQTVSPPWNMHSRISSNTIIQIAVSEITSAKIYTTF